MSKARDLANAGTALTTVSATELGYLDGVTSAVQTQIDSKEATLPSQTGNSGKYLTTNGTAKSWGTVSQYALPSQTGNSGKFLTTNGTSESWGSAGAPVLSTYYLPSNTFSTALYSSPAFVAYKNGYWFTGTTNGFLFYSSDAKNWTRWATGWEGLYAVVRLETNGSTYVIIANSGTVQVASAASLGGTFTNRTSTFSADGANDICWTAGSINLYTIVGDTGKMATSPDGTTWTSRTSGQGTDNLVSVETNGTTHICVLSSKAATNKISYSTNGTTYTAIVVDSSASGRNGQILYDSVNQEWHFQATQSTAFVQTTANIATNWSTNVAINTPLSPGSTNMSRVYTYNTVKKLDTVNNRWITAQSQWGSGNSVVFYGYDNTNLLNRSSGTSPVAKYNKTLGELAIVPTTYGDGTTAGNAVSIGSNISWDYNNGIFVAVNSTYHSVFTNA